MVKTWTYKELDEKYGKLCKRYKQVCYDKQRLEAQLDKEIHINRKMKSALEIYANTEPIGIMQQRWDEKPTTLGKTILDIRKPAKNTLKEIEEME